MSMQPKIFLIGFNRCGAKSLSSIFAHNGLTVAHWDGGKLAENLLLAKQTKCPPLLPWKEVQAFSNIESIHRPFCPPLEGFKHFRFLRQSFPDALFVLNTRDLNDWITSRLMFQKGRFKKKQARLLNVGASELSDIWAKSWEKHHNDCDLFFQNDRRFLKFNVSRDPFEDLQEFMSPFYKITNVPEGINPSDLTQESLNLDSILSEFGSNEPNLEPSRPSQNRALDTAFNSKIVDFCTAGLSSGGPQFNPSRMSQIYLFWDGKDAVTFKKHQDSLLVRSDDLPGRPFLADPFSFKLVRGQVVLNEALSLGADRAIHVDMADARFYGSKGLPAPASPVIGYNRRSGVDNMCLWPLAGYHSIGGPNFAMEQPVDALPFDQKIDKVIWRGVLSGSPLAELGAIPTVHGRASKFINQFNPASVTNGICDDAEKKFIQSLNATPRYRTLVNLMGNSDYDIGIVMSKRVLPFVDHPAFSRFLKNRISNQKLYQYRYILSLSGSDTGSNFFSAINANSVVLKEEDGWELFYTNAFTPWVHYIPIQRGGADIPEKLDWARANPKECKEMIAASHDVCQMIAKPNNRTAYLRGILDTYYGYYG